MILTNNQARKALQDLEFGDKAETYTVTDIRQILRQISCDVKDATPSDIYLFIVC